jgi:tetratricopeptide (TPR) repeat protein
VNRKFRISSLRPLAACALLLVVAACTQKSATESTESAAPAKIPVTTASDEARAAYDKGLGLYDNLKFADAHAAFQEATEADPDFAMAYAMSAQSSQTAADFFAAVDKAKAAAAKASDGEQLYIKALAAGADNDTAGQRATLQDLVSAYPRDERSHFTLAQFLFGQQDFEGAITHLKHATDINPDFAPAYNMLGYSYRSLDKLDDARTAFETYVSLVPNEPNPHDSYAELLMEMGDYDTSIENYRKALDIDPHFASAYIGISTDYALKGDTDQALSTSEKQLAAARNFPERQAALFQTVRVHLFAGDNEAALAACEKMLADADAAGNHAAQGGIHEYMGDIMAVAGDPAKAEEHYTMALQQRQQANLNEANKAQAERAYKFKMAIAAIVAGDDKTAAARADEYTAAAEADGTTFEKRRVHELAGYLAAMNNDPVTSAEQLAQANQLNPIVLYWSAVANRDAGIIAKAVELAKRAANRNTLSPNLPFFRQKALQLIEDLNIA